MQIQTQGGSTAAPTTIMVCTVSSLGHEDRRVLRQNWECLSFHWLNWSYWTWELHLGNFRLCCVVWSREFIPLPLNWDPQGKSPNKTLFLGGSLNNIYNRCSVFSFPTATWPWYNTGNRKEHHWVWSAHPPPISLVLRGSTRGHYPEMRSNRGTAEVQEDDNIAEIYHFLHRISVKGTQLQNQALPYIKPLPAQR